MLTECNGLTYSFFPRVLPVVDNLRVDLTLAVLFPTSDVTLMTIIHISVTQSYIVSSTPEQGSFLQLPYCVTGTNRKCFKTNTMELLPLFCSLSSLSLLKISHVFLWDIKNSVLISIFLPQAFNPEQQLLDSFLCLSFPSNLNSVFFPIDLLEILASVRSLPCHTIRSENTEGKWLPTSNLHVPRITFNFL